MNGGGTDLRGIARRYLEDYTVGETLTSPSYEVTAEEIVEFAGRYDPQPFHTDPAAAITSIFGRHVASGWLTAAITMRLILQSDRGPVGGTIGAGVDSLQWPIPVVPGDVLHLEIEILEVRTSRSNPARGIVKQRIRTLNAAAEAVQILVVNTIVPCRA